MIRNISKLMWILALIFQIQLCSAQNASNPNWLIMIYYDHKNDLSVTVQDFLEKSAHKQVSGLRCA